MNMGFTSQAHDIRYSTLRTCLPTNGNVHVLQSLHPLAITAPSPRPAWPRGDSVPAVDDHRRRITNPQQETAMVKANTDSPPHTA